MRNRVGHAKEDGPRGGFSMDRSPSDQPAGSNAPRLALGVLVIALIGAAGYIYYQQGQGKPAEQKQTAAAPAPAEPAATPVKAIDPAAIGDVLSAPQAQAMLETLSAAPPADRKAWFQVQADNKDTGTVLLALQRIFEQAGWTTFTVRSAYPVKSGIFLMAAEETPPPAVEMVNNAFAAAGIEAQYLTGYRAFYEDRKLNNPNWVGPELAADQSFVVVVGSRPTPKPQ